MDWNSFKEIIQQDNMICVSIILSTICILYFVYKIYKVQKGASEEKATKSYIFIVITSQVNIIFDRFFNYIKQHITYKKAFKYSWKYRYYISLTDKVKLLFYFLLDFLKLVPWQNTIIITLLINNMYNYICSLWIIQKIKQILLLFTPDYIINKSVSITGFILILYGDISIGKPLMSTSIVANVFIVLLKPFKLYLVIDAMVKLILLIFSKVKLNEKYFNHKYFFYIEKNIKSIINYIQNNIYFIYISNILYKLLITSIFIIKPLILFYKTYWDKSQFVQLSFVLDLSTVVITYIIIIFIILLLCNKDFFKINNDGHHILPPYSQKKK